MSEDTKLGSVGRTIRGNHLHVGEMVSVVRKISSHRMLTEDYDTMGELYTAEEWDDEFPYAELSNNIDVQETSLAMAFRPVIRYENPAIFLVGNVEAVSAPDVINKWSRVAHNYQTNFRL